MQAFQIIIHTDETDRDEQVPHRALEPEGRKQKPAIDVTDTSRPDKD